MSDREDNEKLRAALWDLINRWSTEEGYDGAIQRARAILIDMELRHPIDSKGR